MNRNKCKALVVYLLPWTLVITQGCAKPNIQMPETLPSIVKEYKHVVVRGGQQGMLNTGVHLNEGDLLSIIATGASGEIYSRIGVDKYFTPGYHGSGDIRKTDYSGFLYLGDYARGAKGTFNVDIIVWAREDYDAIYHFYKAVKEQNPDNKVIGYALFHADTRRRDKKREAQLSTRLNKSTASAPVIVVASPTDNSKVEVKKLRISGVAEDEKGIQRVDIFINDKPVVLQNTRGLQVAPVKYPSRYEFQEHISLRTGENRIRVVAVDTTGLRTEKVLTIHYAERHKNIWAVVVGIDRYPHVRHLKYAVKDAQAVYHHLIGFNKIPAENVTLLLNEQASLKRLRSALGTHLKNNAGRDDMVFIFFAGHGATEKDVMSPDGDGLEKYLLPFDADPKDLYATAIPMGEVSRIFNRIRSERLVFIADSCYSGASGGRTIGIDGIRANLSDAFFDRVTGGKGRVIISASGANEVSAENDELKQGVFTYYFLEALKGKADIDNDNLVTIDEAFRFVSKHVPQATGQEQHPVKKGTVEGRLVLSVIQ